MRPPPVSLVFDLVLFPFSRDPKVRISLDVERDGDQYIPDQGRHNTDERRPLVHMSIVVAIVIRGRNRGSGWDGMAEVRGGDRVRCRRRRGERRRHEGAEQACYQRLLCRVHLAAEEPSKPEMQTRVFGRIQPRQIGEETEDSSIGPNSSTAKDGTDQTADGR